MITTSDYNMTQTVERSALLRCPKMLLSAPGIMHISLSLFQFFIGLLLILLMQVAAGIVGASFKSEVCTHMIFDNFGKV